MAKTSIKAGVRTGKGTQAVVYGTRNTFTPSAKNMTSRQNYNLGKMQQRTTRKAINKTAENIRAAGEAISSVTTPFAANMTTKTVAEQRTARKRIESQGPVAWNNLIDGNPDKTSGSESNTEKGQSTSSMLGG